ncbi:MAG: hypothetical protein U0354_08305 [Candidatus Sericytochromatia bacterium]
MIKPLNFNRVRIIILTLIFLLLIPKISYSSENKDFRKELIFYSDKLTTVDKDTVILENRVLLIYQTFTLESDYLFIDFKNKQIKAKGNVRAINNEVQVNCDSIEVDMLLESIKLNNAKVDINHRVDFFAKSLFLMKNYYTAEGFKFKDEELILPLKYSVNLEKLAIFPFSNGNFFYLQLNKINGDLFSWENISPIGFPAYSFFMRNPTIARDYIFQRRIRGFFQTGSFFLNAGTDSYRGPWGNITLSYFGNNYSNGFLTLEYGLLSQLQANVYQDLTDNNGNLIQFSGLVRQYDRYLKRPHVSGDLTFLHDWQYETLSIRTSLNQSLGDTIINRLPEVSISSIFRKEIHTGIRYRYNMELTRFIIQEKDKPLQDVGRMRVTANINSPKLFVNDNIYFQLMTDGIISHYFSKETQVSGAGQILFNHDLLKNFSYSLRYRQRLVMGKSGVSFENVLPNQFVGLQLNYRPFEFLEFNVFDEFSIPERKLNDISLVATFSTKYYLTSLLFSIDPYNIRSSGISANFRVKDF